MHSIALTNIYRDNAGNKIICVVVVIVVVVVDPYKLQFMEFDDILNNISAVDYKNAYAGPHTAVAPSGHRRNLLNLEI